MKDDLISRKAAVEFANEQIEKETGMYSKGRNAGLRVMKSALNNPDAIPTAPAVPIDKLIDWLAEGGAVISCSACCTFLGGCIQNDHCPNEERKREVWKKMVGMWMEAQDAR